MISELPDPLNAGGNLSSHIDPQVTTGNENPRPRQRREVDPPDDLEASYFNRLVREEEKERRLSRLADGNAYKQTLNQRFGDILHLSPSHRN
jgi:hypothetical protein